MALVLVVGATGMTGLCLVEQLLERGHEVRLVVRSAEKLSPAILNNPHTTVIKAAVLDFSDQEMSDHVRGCDAVVSCLGHVMDFNGMFGEPKKLCTDATRRLCCSIETNCPAERTKFILMNTVGVTNSEMNEKRNWYERGLLFLLRHLLPPHSDNEMAAEHLQRNIGRDNQYVGWCSVRPDSLIDTEVSSYDIVGSPVTGILTGRPTSRANVAHFMAELIEDEELWTTWQFKMPVIMNSKAIAE